MATGTLDTPARGRARARPDFIDEWAITRVCDVAVIAALFGGYQLGIFTAETIGRPTSAILGHALTAIGNEDHFPVTTWLLQLWAVLWRFLAALFIAYIAGGLMFWPSFALAALGTRAYQLLVKMATRVVRVVEPQSNTGRADADISGFVLGASKVLAFGSGVGAFTATLVMFGLDPRDYPFGALTGS